MFVKLLAGTHNPGVVFKKKKENTMVWETGCQIKLQLHRHFF